MMYNYSKAIDTACLTLGMGFPSMSQTPKTNVPLTDFRRPYLHRHAWGVPGIRRRIQGQVTSPDAPAGGGRHVATGGEGYSGELCIRASWSRVPVPEVATVKHVTQNTHYTCSCPCCLPPRNVLHQSFWIFVSVVIHMLCFGIRCLFVDVLFIFCLCFVYYTMFDIYWW